jgi:uncharacterized protein (DUF934 family)
MAIFNSGGLATNEWRYLAEGEALPPDGKVILTLAQWQEVGAQTRGVDIVRPLGLAIQPGQDFWAALADLSCFDLIVIVFSKFTDGRGYSLARKLRGHYGYAGELRASGEILFDQLQLLVRCGFDSFEVTNAATLRLLEAGRRPSFEIFYQPALGPERRESTRPWARRATL